MMKLTQNSKKLMEFFIKKNCLNGNECLTRNTQSIVKRLYNELVESNRFVDEYIRREGFRLNIERILTSAEVPKPKLFNASAFPEVVRKHIDETSSFCFSYTFSLFDREFKVKFIIEEANAELMIDIYNDYFKKILVWFRFIHKYSSNNCSKTLIIYIYFTSLTKLLPESNIHILQENNINTAFTYTCRVNSEIVVFRKEEWLKVLMHETMHNFALDFSDMNYKEVDDKIVELFPVATRGNSFEAYTEFWAEIMNAVFCSYYMMSGKEKHPYDEFVKNFEFFINFEKAFGIFQMVKTLHFMGLEYSDLYSSSEKSKMMRRTMYKEKSNVLSYYVVRVILLYNFQTFLKWCSKNNSLLIQFKKTSENMMLFFEFIKDNYKKKDLLMNISHMEKVVANFKKSRNLKKTDKGASASGYKKEYDFIANNMRMSICELG